MLKHPVTHHSVAVPSPSWEARCHICGVFLSSVHETFIEVYL